MRRQLTTSSTSITGSLLTVTTSWFVGLIDSHQYVKDPDAYRILEHTTNTAIPHLPGKAIEQGITWRPGTDESYTWDESYTISENLFLAYQRGAGER